MQHENNIIPHEQQREENIKKYLSENLAADLHAAAVAAKFNVSISAFLHFFKKHQGQPYRKYLEEIRMNKALELLKTEGMRIKEVMYATGYRNKTTFNNAFKKRFGYPPSHFRK